MGTRSIQTKILSSTPFMACSMLQSVLRWKFHLIGALVCSLSASVVWAQGGGQNPPPADQKAAAPKLPEGYEAPRTVPPVMTFDKELTNDVDDDRLYKELRSKDKYTILFSNANLDANAKQIIEKWAKWRLYQMTLKSNRQRLHEVRAELTRDVGYAGRSSGLKRQQVEEFRRYLCEEVVARATELLKNNFHVRLNATIVLANLNLTDEHRKNNVPEQAYAKAAIPLLDILKTKTGGGLDEQLEAVKVQAAIGLKRIALIGDNLNYNVAGENLESHIAKTLIAQLQDPNANPWYQKRLLEALAALKISNDVTTGKPIIIQTLGEVLADPKRDFDVRAHAAREFGRATLPPSFNNEKLVFQILLLEHEMALAYQKSPDDFRWLNRFGDLYFAFHAYNRNEIELFEKAKKSPPGLNRGEIEIGKLPSPIKEGYLQMLPIVKNVVQQPGWSVPKEFNLGRQPNEKIPADLITNLATWLSENQPASHKLDPSLPDLAPGAPVPGAKKTASAGS